MGHGHTDREGWYLKKQVDTRRSFQMFERLGARLLDDVRNKSDISCLINQPGTIPVQYTQLSSGRANCSCRTNIDAIIGIL